MPLHWDISDCSEIQEEVWKSFTTPCENYWGTAFEALCRWLYDTRFNYGDRKRDCVKYNNAVVFTTEHVDRVITEGVFTEPSPELQREALKQFVGLKVWAT